MTHDVILIDDEAHLRTACTQAFELAGLSVAAFDSAESALHEIDRNHPGIVVTDVKMAGMGGLQLLTTTLERDPQLPVILITGHGDISMAVKAIQDGAYDFLEKPFASERLVDVARRALELRRLVLENRALRSAVDTGDGLEQLVVRRTPAMVRLRELINSYGATDADVLVLGETGTGKELVARALHERSARAKGRFVPINCGALPENIIESELFGHIPGAFTGATAARVGKFEYANGGTLFLDEIESMPLDLQTQLLRVLQERTIVRLGTNEETPVDVRIIAATKSDLAEKSENGQFRADLFFRLNVLALEVPPLRSRHEDIPLLFAHFLDQFAARFKRAPVSPDPREHAILMARAWPGNVRELQNVAMRYALGFGLEPADTTLGASASNNEDLPDRVATFERAIIQQTLLANNGRLKPTYEQLGISRKTLYEKIRKHGLQAREDEAAE